MALLQSIGGELGKATNLVKNPFSSSFSPSYNGQDFPEGFLIEEILYNGNTGDKIRLRGSMMPKVPFSFGGSQRVKKDYYPGYSEPAVHVFGPEESDITISGTFKDKKLPNDFRGVSSEVQQLIEAIRIRGNIVRIALGEFERYGMISEAKFDMKTLQEIDYKITFSIFGFNAPSNARFLQRSKEVPFTINKELIASMQAFQEMQNNKPGSVPFSIADQLDQLTNTVATAVATVTDFVDTVLSTVNNVQKSVERAKGLVKYAQNKLKEYKKTVGAFNAFDSQQAITGRYESSRFYGSVLSGASALTSMLERLKLQIDNIQSSTPIARHMVREGDSLQKLSSKYYGDPSNWGKIKEFNNLTSDELVTGSIVEIPRL